jgi:hypothetical protein
MIPDEMVQAADLRAMYRQSIRGLHRQDEEYYPIILLRRIDGLAAIRN